MGASFKEIEEVVFGQFKLKLVWMNLKILLAYLVVGGIAGGFSLLLKLKKIHTMLLFNLFFWFMFWWRAVKLFPQLFIEQLYVKSVVLKYCQVFVTDHLPLYLVYLLYILTVGIIGVVNKRYFQALGVVAISFLMIVQIPVSATSAPEGMDDGRPNVLIFGTDSLRPQSLSFHGYHRPTPHIDGLLSGGASFLNAKTSMGRTLPTWTSILTSGFPPDHTMRHMFPDSKDLEKTWPTVVKTLNENGYHTAVVSDFAGDIFPNVKYGFQDITSPSMDVESVLKQRCQEIHYFLQGFLINPLGRVFFPEIAGMTLNKDPWYVTQDAKKAIKRSFKKKKPFFLVYFSSNNHFPYVTKYPYYELYSKENYIGRHKYGLSSEIIKTFLGGAVTPEGREQVVNLYDNATRLFDDNLGEILDYLKRCKIDKKTIVIVMSDHGENLYDEEHYGVAHGDHLLGAYATNIVLGVYSPFEDFKGRKIAETVRDIDIAPTVLDMLNVPAPSSFRGASLLPAMRGEPFDGLPAYMETGIWYSPNTPYIPHRIRIPYPGILQMLKPEMPAGKIVLKKEFESATVRGKYKVYQLNEKKYLYMPGETEYREEFYIDEKRVLRDSITDEAFLKFKEKMVEMFTGKFYIDDKGFIREYRWDK